MNPELPFGLRLAFLLSAIAGTVYGIAAMLAPKLVANLSGLPGVDLPVYQQAGALSFGPAIASVFALRSRRWNQVRVAAIGIFANVLLSALGAFYYVVLQGVTSLALIGILVYTLYATIAFGVYLYRFSR